MGSWERRSNLTEYLNDTVRKVERYYESRPDPFPNIEEILYETEDYVRRYIDSDEAISKDFSDVAYARQKLERYWGEYTTDTSNECFLNPWFSYLKMLRDEMEQATEDGRYGSCMSSKSYIILYVDKAYEQFSKKRLHWRSCNAIIEKLLEYSVQRPELDEMFVKYKQALKKLPTDDLNPEDYFRSILKVLNETGVYDRTFEEFVDEDSYYRRKNEERRKATT
jgi:hypothetical protein